jgi:hypothetical protein
VKLLKPVTIPPHFSYFCDACETDFSTTERTPYQQPGEPLKPMVCAVCAAVENRRRAA